VAKRDGLREFRDPLAVTSWLRHCLHWDGDKHPRVLTASRFIVSLDSPTDGFRNALTLWLGNPSPGDLSSIGADEAC